MSSVGSQTGQHWVDKQFIPERTVGLKANQSLVGTTAGLGQKEAITFLGVLLSPLGA